MQTRTASACVGVSRIAVQEFIAFEPVFVNLPNLLPLRKLADISGLALKIFDIQ
jgi:hypothetical protein